MWRRIVIAITFTLLAGIIATQYGLWCGIGAFMLLLSVYKSQNR